MKKKSSHYQEPQKQYYPKRFLKEQKKPIQKQESFTQTVKTFWTNLTYKVSSAFHSEKKQVQQNKNVTILGAKYKNVKQAKAAVQKVFWFTYRNKLNIKNEFSSDVGWGCLVRVGQMALASGLQRFLKHNGYFGECQILNIINACIDEQSKEQKYSLNKFVNKAQLQLNHKVGQWFDLTKICYTLSQLQNRNPMKGTQKLKVAYFDQILQIKTILTIENIRICACQKKRIKCDKCYEKIASQTYYSSLSQEKKIYDTSKGGFMKNGFQQKNKGKLSLATKTVNFMEPFFKKNFFNQLIIIIVSQVSFGQNSQERQSARNAIYSLLDLNISLGILTGFPKKAIYVLGRQGQELIYLDPHYVQKSVSKNFQNFDIDSFFCKDYNKTRPQKLDNSLAFAFYIRNLNDLDQLYKTIIEINYKFKGRLAIGYDWNSCNYDQQQFNEQIDDRVSQMSFFTP